MLRRWCNHSPCVELWICKIFFICCDLWSSRQTGGVETVYLILQLRTAWLLNVTPAELPTDSERSQYLNQGFTFEAFPFSLTKTVKHTRNSRYLEIKWPAWSTRLDKIQEQLLDALTPILMFCHLNIHLPTQSSLDVPSGFYYMQMFFLYCEDRAARG